MSEVGPRKPPQDQSSGSGHTVTTSRHQYLTDTIASKRVCFYKSGDPQFSGLRMVINNRTYKTFDALLDSLSKKVPLPFGVRNITTPRGIHAVHTLEELEDGKAYICSDQRKVKPINLAVASKKLPPWYHARPISARRRTLQLAKQNAGRPVRKKTPVIVGTPKRLMVFRNGDPGIKHNLMLQRRTTPTFEALLDYVSELMHFPVVKLHTTDGRRVDGLLALILCSGVVVAAGREAFKPGNYKTQKSSGPTWLSAKRMTSKRLKKPTPRKKKSVSSSKSLLFSPSSERYFVNQIHHSIAESQHVIPSNTTGSVELEAAHFLESVAETDADTYHGDGVDRVGNCMPGDDDIEKSFRVNQDGSMTVEMKVRLTVKEEETIHWTTTLTRSSVASQLSAASVAESEPENCSPEANTLPPAQPNDIGTMNMYNTKKEDRDDEDDMSPEASFFISVEGDEENDTKTHVGQVSPWRAPTPGARRYRPKLASLESIQTSSGDEIQENVLGSYSYRETTDNREIMEEYCMVRQCSSRPVPKPRNVGSMDFSNYNTQSTLKSGKAEILEICNGKEEVRESVINIYENPKCQDKFLANNQFSVHGVSINGLTYGRPSTSDSSCIFATIDQEQELRPSTASESIRVWRADRSLSSDFMPTFKVGRSLLNNRTLNVQKLPLSKLNKDNETSGLVSEVSKDNSTSKVVNKVKRTYAKATLKNQVLNNTHPDKRHKESKVDADAFRRNLSIRKIYGPKPKRSLIRNKKKLKGKGIKSIIEDRNASLVKERNVIDNKKESSVSGKKDMLHVSLPMEIQMKGTLKRQKSMNETHGLSENMPLPALSSSSSNNNEYVENWLENALPTVYPEETQYLAPRLQAETEEQIQDVSEINCEKDIKEEMAGYLKQNAHVPISSSWETRALSNRTFANTATQTGLTLENTALSGPSDSSSNTATQTGLTLENTALSGQSDSSLKAPLQTNATPKMLPTNLSTEKTTIPKDCDLPSPHSSMFSAEKTFPCQNPSLDEMSILTNVSLEKPPIINESSFETKSVPNNYSIERTAVSENQEKIPLHATTQTEKTPSSNKDLSSIDSSPSYFMCSSPSSLGDEERPLSKGISSDEAPILTGHVFEKKKLFNCSTMIEPPSPKLSTKKTRLVSNLSLEKQLSLRKSSVERFSISSDSMVENALPVNTPIFNSHSSEISLPAKTKTEMKPPPNKVLNEALLSRSSSYFMSPTSFTSAERSLSICHSSEDTPTPTSNVLEKTTLFSHSVLKESSSPKLPMKKTRLISNLSLEKQLSLRRESVEKSSIPTDSTLEMNQISDSPRKGRTPLPRNLSLKKLLSPERTTLTRPLMTSNTSALSNLSLQQTPVPSNHTLKNRLSPYSQSLDIVSPPMSHKSKKEPISRNHSLESKPSSVSPTLKRTPLPRKSLQTLSPKSVQIQLNSSLEKKSVFSSSANDEERNNDKLRNEAQGDITTVKPEQLPTKTLLPSHPNKLPAQPDMKPVLEKLCFSIQSIRQITNNNRPSCLEKSNSLPDFSSHVASTFGSSSKALLAFLSVITLKESFSNWNIPELNVNSVSCAEALKMMETLREIANIEDAEELKDSLSALQKSTSTQLLQSWKGFQELNEVRSCRSTPNSSEQDVISETCPVEANKIQENALYIDELINELDMPEKLKEALAALPPGLSVHIEVDEIETPKESNEKAESLSQESVNDNSSAVHKEQDANEHILNEANVDVKSIIERFTNIHHHKVVSQTEVSPIAASQGSRQEQYHSSEKQSLKVDYICPTNGQAAYKESSELMVDNCEEEEAKCADKQIDCNEEQTSSEIEQAYSLALHDGYLDNPAFPADAKEKDGNIQSRHLEEKVYLKENQEYFTENLHVKQKIKCMEPQDNSDGNRTKHDQTSSDEDLDCPSSEPNRHKETNSKCAKLKVSCKEESLEEDQDYYIENPHMEDQHSNDDIEYNTEEDQASSKHHEEPEVPCVDLKVNSQERENNIENLPSYELNSTERQVSCKGNLNLYQACPKKEKEWHGKESKKHVEDECLEKVLECHIENRPSRLELPVCYEERDSTPKDRASTEEELNCHTKVQRNHQGPEYNCLELQNSSEEVRSTHEEDQASSEEELKCHVVNQPNNEKPEVKCINRIICSVESMSCRKEEQASSEEYSEPHLDNSHEMSGDKYTENQVFKKQPEFLAEEKKARYEKEEKHNAENLSFAEANLHIGDKHAHLCLKQSSEKEVTLTGMQSSLVKQHSSVDGIDIDSGKESEQTVSSDQQFDTEDNLCRAEEKQVNYEEKQTSSEEEHVGVDDEPFPEESYAEYDESFIEEQTSEEDKISEKPDKRITSCFQEHLPSVAERIKLLDKKIASVEQGKTITTETTGISKFAQIDVHAVSNTSNLSNEQANFAKSMEDGSNMHTTHLVVKDVKEQDKASVQNSKRTRWPRITSETSVTSLLAPPSSSLAFSYDSCITKELERNRVKAIKDMFMAKSVVDTQYGQARLPSPNTSDLSDNRPESSDSSVHRSSRTTEMSSGEDDSVKKSITKGFVRRTIESLYGKNNKNIKDPVHESRPLSVSKQKSREFIGKISRSPFQIAPTKGISDVSYFNATSSFDTYTEPTRCVAFNAKVGPGNSVPIDKDRWVLSESVIRKSVSEPVDINKKTSTSTEDLRTNTKENVPYSLFSSTNFEDAGKSVKPLVPKCTYFNLPHGCDSDPHQDDLTTAKGDISKDSKDEAKEPQQCLEKNEMLTDSVPTDIKRANNKVHPLTEGAGEGQIVLAQPGKKRQADIKNIPQEPDALEMLYLTCGQHCPIL